MKTKTFIFSSGFFIAALLTLHSRSTPEDVAKANFAAECTSPSDPSDRLLFAHEDMVNSFLDVPQKFGFYRMAEMHASSARLAKHGGVTSPRSEWNEGGVRYALHPNWGLVGGIVENDLKVYTLKQVPFLTIPMANWTAEQKKIEQRATDSFEGYALTQLRKGEAVVRWERPGFMRAMGAIRANEVCLRCHEVKAGDLLGAFTYEFEKKNEPLKESQKDDVARYRKGESVVQIAKSIEDRFNHDDSMAIIGVELLDGGIVLPEALEKQQAKRKELLKWVESDFGRPGKSSLFSH